MLIFYFEIFLVILIAILFMHLPVFKYNLTHALIVKQKLIFLIPCMILFSISLYVLFGNPLGLREWINHGRFHYNLLVQYDKLGGNKGAIMRIQKKLAIHPNDIKGWLLLAKLYQAENNLTDAEKALAKARQLQAEAHV